MTDLGEDFSMLTFDLGDACVSATSVAGHLIDRRHDSPADVAAHLDAWHELLVRARDLKDIAEEIYRQAGGVLAAHYRAQGRKSRDQWEEDGRTLTLTGGTKRKTVDHEALANALVEYCDENGLGPALSALTVLNVVPLTASTAVRVGAMRRIDLNPDLYIEWSDRGPDRVTVSAAPFQDIHQVEAGE
jgi:hypothetical protein